MAFDGLDHLTQALGMVSTGDGEDGEIQPAVPPGTLVQGYLSPASQTFCSVYRFLSFAYFRALREKMPEPLREELVAKDILWNRKWHLYYLWTTSSTKPLILLPACQFEEFMQSYIGPWFPEKDVLHHATYARYRDIELLLDFPEHPRFTPRYLGSCNSRSVFQKLVRGPPSKDFRPCEEPPEPALEQDDIDTFNAIIKTQVKLQATMKTWQTINLLQRASLIEKDAYYAEKRQRKKSNQARKHQAAADTFKRAQRYFGMRPKNEAENDTVSLPRIDPDKAVPYTVATNISLVCFDLESWERNHNIITEVGIAILSLSDLAAQPIPGGKLAKNWQSLVQAHHFRIVEHNHFKNGDFVRGNPYGFHFGTSQDISINTASLLIEDLFDHLTGTGLPSNPNEPLVQISPPPAAEKTPKPAAAPAEQHKIVLVGHAIAGDIAYLDKLGFNASQHSAVVDTLDTQTLWHVLNGCVPEASNAGLTKLLTELEIEYSGLHNAGNDAVYTMYALLGMMVLEGTLREGGGKSVASAA